MVLFQTLDKEYCMEVGIIGGGILGCTLGYHFSKAGHRVHILESGSQPGGLSTWFNFGDFIWDKYYHVILTSDEHLLKLIDNLGLSDKLYWAETKTGFLWKGRHISLSNYWEFLTFPPLNLYEKGRLGFGILYNNFLSDPTHLATMTAKTYLQKVFGKAVYKTIWEPLLESKFGVLRDEIPATIIWSTMKRYASTRNKGSAAEKMGHLKGGGLKVLLECLLDHIVNAGGEIICGERMTGIRHEIGQSVQVSCEKRNYTFDRVVSTIPTALLQSIAPNLKGLYSPTPKPHYLGVIRLALVLKKPLSPFYITNLIDRGSPFTGIIEVSRLGEPNEFGGHDFVMVPRYDIPESPWFKKTDEEIKQAFLERLKATFPDIESNVIASFVHREKIVQALWIDSPPPHEKAARTSDNRVWNVNNELAGYSTLNNNSVVEVANRVASEWCERDR